MEGNVQSRLLDFLILNTMLIANIMDLPAFFDKFRNQEKVEGYMPDRSSACKYKMCIRDRLQLLLQKLDPYFFVNPFLAISKKRRCF